MSKHPIDHSQCGESTWILENLKPEIGTFCEVGAFDGIQSSNTYLFEQLGWRGLLVEADPYLAAKCQQNRKAVTACCAAGNFEGPSDFFINPQDRGLSGIKRPGEKVTVMVHFLYDMLQMNGLENLDLLSIDTEGTELNVWEGLRGIRPKIVVVEYQTCDEPSQEIPITSRMIRDGYEVRHRTLYNLVFTRK